MRSLILWKVSHASLTEAEFSSSTEPESHITAVAEDLDQHGLVLATESSNGSSDREVRLELWTLSNEDALVSRSFLLFAWKE